MATLVPILLHVALCAAFWHVAGPGLAEALAQVLLQLLAIAAVVLVTVVALVCCLVKGRARRARPA
jgi:heme/copper-type cytochrome/quinol oxidase subunit 2